jgi:hypothetical protein
MPPTQKRRPFPPSHPASASASKSRLHDPLDYQIRARNDNDHSEWIPKTQVTPELLAEVSAVAISEQFEFGSISAFVRWACVRGIEELKALKPDFPTNISIIRAMERESARMQTRIDFLDHIEKKAREAFELEGRGLHTEAAKHVFAVLGDIRKMNPADPWRAVFEAEWKKRFGSRLTRGRIVSHVPEPEPLGPQLDPDWEMPPLEM